MRFLGSNLTSTILIVHMDHLSAAGSSATRNLTTTETPKSLNRRKTVDFRFQRPHATSGSFVFTNRCAQWIPDVILHPKKYFQAIFLNWAKKLTLAYIKY